jgi:Tfp pilus assembly protein PilN
MFQAFKQKIVKQNIVAGISVHFAQDGALQYSYCLLEQEKGLIVIKAQEANIDDLDKIKTAIPPNYPLAIHIDGKGFLHKNIGGSKVERHKIVSAFIPNAKDEDFYLQQTTHYISIIRKNVLEKWLSDFSKQIEMPVAVSFGPFVLELILPLISSLSGTLAGYALSIIENHIVGFSVNVPAEDALVKVGDQELKSSQLLSYAVALQFLVRVEVCCEGIQEVEKTAADWTERLFFKKAGWAVMIFFLGLLLLNFVLYSIYDDKNKELQKQRYGSGNEYALQENLQKQVKQKEEFLQKAGWLSPSKMSYYADRLASAVPVSIKLTDMKLHPEEEVVENEIKKQVFRNGEIVITGTCSNPLALNSWIKLIDSYAWIESVNLNNYLYDNREHLANFKLDIKIKE